MYAAYFHWHIFIQELVSFGLPVNTSFIILKTKEKVLTKIFSECFKIKKKNHMWIIYENNYSKINFNNCIVQTSGEALRTIRHFIVLINMVTV